ncbi:MAG TPA: PaaI family thioesterase [Solirubrobacter sp.]|nr:PaaI family thioesterase [Solirubrobacter sp.]
MTQPSTDGRVRTFTWADPLATAAAAASLPGLEALRRVASGELPPPPIASLLDFEIEVVEPGRVVFAFTPAEWMYNPIGSVHGGVAATLLDSSLGCAVHTMLDAGQRYTTSDLQVRYVRALETGVGRVLSDSHVVHVGRRLATAEGRLFAEDGGTLYAHATTSCLIL